ncbi:hypothetical protein [Streptomyces katrae]|uniref:hypothetical protein n=1 Tax=Streptomyces katrae TaxID=68223 RepID=UPI000997A9BB|nr:hypothetical protein [Streptomyces katrae]
MTNRPAPSLDPGRDEALDQLDTLLDQVSEPRVKLISAGEGRALMVLLGLLDAAELPEDIRRAAGEMRFRLGSGLA